MNYDEIKDLAISYSDRSDAEVTDRIDNFIKLSEVRMNRKLMTMDMTTRAFVLGVSDQRYYTLPSDFNGLRDIEVKATVNNIDVLTYSYCNPEQMNDAPNANGFDGAYYSLIANQIMIYPTIADDMILEIVYYQKVPNLNAVDTENWMSLDCPDAYVFAILVEISSFTKDYEAVKLWIERFNESMKDIENRDQINRWSGTPMQIRYEE